MNTAAEGGRPDPPARPTRTCKLHLDVKAMSAEAAPTPDVIRANARVPAPLPRQRPEQARPGVRRHRLQADLPGAAGRELRGLGVGRGVRLLARPGHDRPREHPVHARVRVTGEPRPSLAIDVGLPSSRVLPCDLALSALLVCLALVAPGRRAGELVGRVRRGRRHAGARQEAGLPRRVRPEPQGDEGSRPDHGPGRRAGRRRREDRARLGGRGRAVPAERRAGPRASCPGSSTSSSPATHNHEGPDTLGLWGPSPFQSGIDPEYLKQVEDGCVEAVNGARTRPASPPRPKIGTATRPGAAPRRPPADRQARRPGGAPLRATRRRGKPLGILVQWNCHPETLDVEEHRVSADYVVLHGEAPARSRRVPGRVLHRHRRRADDHAAGCRSRTTTGKELDRRHVREDRALRRARRRSSRTKALDGGGAGRR